MNDQCKILCGGRAQLHIAADVRNLLWKADEFFRHDSLQRGACPTAVREHRVCARQGLEARFERLIGIAQCLALQNRFGDDPPHKREQVARSVTQLSEQKPLMLVMIQNAGNQARDENNLDASKEREY